MIDRNDPQLLQFILGELPEDQMAQIQAQVEDSPELQVAVEELLEITQILERNFESETLPRLSSRQIAAINSACESSDATTSSKPETPNPFQDDSSFDHSDNTRLAEESQATRMDKSYSPRVPYSALAVGGVLSLLILCGVWSLLFHAENPRPEEMAAAGKANPNSQLDIERHERALEVFEFDADQQESVKKVETITIDGTDIVILKSELDSIRAETRSEEKLDRESLGFAADGALANDGLSKFYKAPDQATDLSTKSHQMNNGEFLLNPLVMEDRLAEKETRLALLDPTRNYSGVNSIQATGRVDSYGTINLAQAGEKEFLSENDRLEAKFMFGRNGKGYAEDNNIARGTEQSGEASEESLTQLKRLVKEAKKDIEGKTESLDKFGIEQTLSFQIAQRRRKAVQNLLESRFDISGVEVEFTPQSPIRLKGKQEDIAKAMKLIRKVESAGFAGKLNENEAILAQLLKPQDGKKTKSWKRVKALPNTSRLMVGDKDELEMKGLQANVRIEGYRARVLLDCFYYNDRAKNLEGTFKIRLPDDASLFYFAFGESAYHYKPDELDLTKKEFQQQSELLSVSYIPEEITTARKDDWRNVKEARCAEKQKAAFAYTQTVKRRVDPALVEWAGAGVFNASVFPLTSRKMHRIVIGYDVDLRLTEDKLRYDFALPENVKQSAVHVQVIRTPGLRIQSNLDEKPIVTPEIFQYSFQAPTQPVKIEIQREKSAVLQSPDQKYFATRVQPLKDMTKAASASSQKAVFLLDTSLSSDPDKFNIWLKMMRRVLHQNREQIKEFAVLIFNVENYWWKDSFAANSKENVAALMKDCQQLSLLGATDLNAALQTLNQTSWISEAQNLDCFLLSDGATTWGERNLLLLQSEFKKLNGSRLIAYQSGLAGTAIGTLRPLAQATGGAVFSVVNESEVAKAAIAHRTRPWHLDSLELDGAEDVLTAGRVQWVYPGQTISIAGRGNPTGNIVFNLSQNGKTRKIRVQLGDTVQSTIAKRTFGQIAVGQLESLGGLEKQAAVAFARAFRVPGQNCSLVMLETEADYKRFELNPKGDSLMVETTLVSPLVSQVIRSLTEKQHSPKKQLQDWLDQLESQTPGQKVVILPAFKQLIRTRPDEDFLVRSESLTCQFRSKSEKKHEQRWGIQSAEWTNSSLGSMAHRLQTEGAPVHDRVRTLSSFVESNPGHFNIGKSIAQKLIDLEMPGHSFYLLRDHVRARPFDSDNYLSLGNCLFQLKKYTYSMLCYEIALNSKFTNNKGDFQKIVAHDYARLLKKISAGENSPSVLKYANARLSQLEQEFQVREFDLAIKLTWNTDSTDIDLHVTEPGGEKCYYQNTDTRSGGHLTSDIRDGFGPELYTLRKAPKGKYRIQVEYFGENRNRLTSAAQATIEVIQNYGRANEKVTRKSVELQSEKALIDVLTVGVK